MSQKSIEYVKIIKESELAKVGKNKKLIGPKNPEVSTSF